MQNSNNKFKFVSLKPFLTILAVVVLITTASAQTSKPIASPAQNVVKVVRFYPNPATSFINFEFKDVDFSNLSFKIFNFIGKRVLEMKNVSPRTVINLNDYFRGIYVFQLSDRNGIIIESGKFQVVR